MNIEERAKQLIDQFKSEMKTACDDVLTEAWCEILPHAESDTVQNVETRMQQAINNLISGRFEYEQGSDFVLIKMVDGIDFRVRMTDYHYDKIRKSLLEVMPQCPKDLEIKNLREQLAEAHKLQLGE